jgi:hypothetical protein
LSWFDEGWNIEKCALLDNGNLILEYANSEVLRTFKGNLGLAIVCARKE